jgi:hypothetical protein
VPAPRRIIQRMRRSPLLLVVLAVAGCGTLGLGADPGPQRTEERQIDDATEVELATSGNLVLRTGESPSLEVQAGENVLDHLTTDVRDGRLILDDDGSSSIAGDIRFEVVLPAVDRLVLSGSGDADVRPPSVLERIELSGSGDIAVEGLATDDLTVELSGSGTVSVAGDATRQTVSLDGSGTYDGRGVTCDDATVTVSGSGTAEVTVSGTLEAVVEGSGTITYAGDPALDSRIDGSGEVTRR